MTGRRFRWPGLGVAAGGGAAMLVLMSMMHSAFAYRDDTASAMGPIGFPVPSPLYVDAANDLYIQKSFLGARP